MMRKVAVILGWIYWLCITTTTSFAQVSIGGLVDMELRKGGSDSSPVINQTPDSKWSVYTPTMRLFMEGSISEQWFVSAALQADHYHGTSLSSPFFSVLNVNWVSDTEWPWMVTGGRFVTPFAGYSDLLLSSQNKFVHLPMAMSRNVTVDKFRGYFSGNASYSGTHGMSMLYQRMYTQGLKLEGGSLQNNKFTFQLAATMSSVSSHMEFGEHDRPNLIATLTAQPAIWSKLGLSVNYGPYMRRDEINEEISDDRLAEYDQLAVGAFTEFSYSYFVLRFAGIWNRWNTPWLGYSGATLYEEIDASLGHLMGQLTYRFPFWVGGYAGVRIERLMEGSLENNGASYNPTLQPYQLPSDWLDDTTRLEGVIGYKLDRNILLKASYLYAQNENGDLADNVFSIQISAGF